jgi:hypothetical protein
MFDSVARKFQLRFKDRITAANILGNALKDEVRKESNRISSSLKFLGMRGC